MYKIAGFSCGCLASPPELTSVIITNVPKTPIGASAGGRFFVTPSTLFAGTLPVCIAFARDDWWFGRIVPYGICTALLSKMGEGGIPKIRIASGSMSLLETQEGRPGPGMEEAAVVKHSHG